MKLFYKNISSPNGLKRKKENVHRLKTITEFEMVVKELYQKGIKSIFCHQ